MVESRKKGSGRKGTKKAVKTKKTIKTQKAVKAQKAVKVKKDIPPAAYAPQVGDEIPHGYNIDTIVLMPVNRDTSFVYWEITDRLLNGSRKKLQAGTAELMIKVFEEDCTKEVCSFSVRDRIGNSYINYRSSLKPFVAEIGISNGNGYVGLLKSRTISTPNYSQVLKDKKSPKRAAASAETTKELWMTRKENRREIVSRPAGGSPRVQSGIMEYYREIAVFHDSSLSSKI